MDKRQELKSACGVHELILNLLKKKIGFIPTYILRINFYMYICETKTKRYHFKKKKKLVHDIIFFLYIYRQPTITFVHI